MICSGKRTNGNDFKLFADLVSSTCMSTTTIVGVEDG